MGERPAGTTLGRIDNNGPYTKQNCRWETRLEQARNTSRIRSATVQGRTDLIVRLAETHGIPLKTVNKRLQRGWNVERAFLAPVQQRSA